MKYIYILFTVILLASCSKSLIHQYTKNEIIMEKINIKQLKDWSNKKNIDKLKKNQEIRYEATGEGGFSLIEQENDIVTTIRVSKKDNLIIGISKQIDDRKNLTQENINYHLNGMIKRRLKRNKPQKINNAILGEISIDYLNDKVESFDENGKLIYKVDFNEIFLYPLKDLLNDLEAKSFNSEMHINRIYIDDFFTVIPLFAINLDDIEKKHPYWGVSYIIPDTSGFKLNINLLFDGVTGKFVKEKQIRIGTAMDHRLPTKEGYFESQRKEFEKYQITIDSTDRKK